MSKGPPISPLPKSRRGYVLVPVGLLGAALAGGGAGTWAGARTSTPVAVAPTPAPAPAQLPQVCEDLGAVVKRLEGEVAGLKQESHDRAQRERTLQEVEDRLRDLQRQAGPGPLKRQAP